MTEIENNDSKNGNFKSKIMEQKYIGGNIKME